MGLKSFKQQAESSGTQRIVIRAGVPHDVHEVTDEIALAKQNVAPQRVNVVEQTVRAAHKSKQAGRETAGWGGVGWGGVMRDQEWR